ncbi:MAG: hypothetical protein JRH07_11300, partial [Deltaproteobacteria bacterium]|nr:hypothetical protein [Deltaproteobacteria bacterium]
MSGRIFDSFFAPKGVAFFGSIRPGKIGYEIIKSTKEGGFEGRVYPI